jgi:hypothetical protein
MRTGGQNRHKKHHDLEVDAPPFDPQAVKDLEKAKLGQKFGETMFRFRLSGEKRHGAFATTKSSTSSGGIPTTTCAA